MFFYDRVEDFYRQFGSKEFKTKVDGKLLKSYLKADCFYFQTLKLVYNKEGKIQAWNKISISQEPFYLVSNFKLKIMPGSTLRLFIDKEEKETKPENEQKTSIVEYQLGKKRIIL